MAVPHRIEKGEDAVSAQPPEVSGHHRETLRRLFAHPLSHNIEWHDVVSLLREVAIVKERKDGKLEITATDRTFVLVKPRDKDVSVDELIEVRHLLEALGYRADTT